MQNRTMGIVLTALSAFICGCAGLFSCIWGALIATGTPIDVTSNGITAPQILSPTIGYALVCLSLLFLLVPVGVGFFTLRKRDPAM